MIEGKIVRLGNSAAITVSKKDLERNRLRFNQRVQFAVLRTDKEKILKEMFGSARNAKPFSRERHE